MLTLKRMHHMKRTITALIAALVLAPTVGCGNDEFGTDDFNWDDIPVNEEAGPPPVDGPTNPVKILKKIPDCKLEPGSEHGTADINGNLFASCDLELASVLARIVGVDPALFYSDDNNPDDSHRVIHGSNFYVVVTADPSDFVSDIDMNAIATAVGGKVVKPTN